MSRAFKREKESYGWIPLRKRNDVEAARVIENDSFTAECTITVVTELPPEPDTAKTNVVRPRTPPLSGLHSLHHDLGELLSKATGSDVMLVVSGETFAAHKAILASRSPVFMTQFFGPMKETRSERVEIIDMEAAVFGAMLRFIYTDWCPSLSGRGGAILLTTKKNSGKSQVFVIFAPTFQRFLHPQDKTHLSDLL
jgi:speckle-type POZ protein